METDAIKRKVPTLLRLSSEEENYGVIAAPPSTPIDPNLPTFVELNENDFQAEQEKPGQSAVVAEEIEKTNVLESLELSTKGSSMPEVPCGKDDDIEKTRKSFEEITEENENTDSLRHEIHGDDPDGNVNSKPKTQKDTAENDTRKQAECTKEPAELFVDVESEIPSQKKSDPGNSSKGLIQTFPPPKPPAPQNLGNVEDHQEVIKDSNSEETKSPIRNLPKESTAGKNRKSLPPPRPPPPNTQKNTEKNRRSLPPPRPPAPRRQDDPLKANPQNQKETSRILEENSNELVDTVDGNICSKPLKTIDDQENVQDHLEVDRKSQDDVTIEYVELDFTSSNQDEKKASLDKSIEHQVVDLPADIKVKKVIDLDEMIKTKVDSPRLPSREAKNQENRQIVSQVSTLERLPSIDENAEVNAVEDIHTISEPVSKWKPSLPPTKPKRLEENLENPELEEIQKEDQPLEKEINTAVEPEIELVSEPIKKEKPPLPTLSSKPQHVDDETKDEIESSSKLLFSSPKLKPKLPQSPKPKTNVEHPENSDDNNLETIPKADNLENQSNILEEDQKIYSSPDPNLKSKSPKLPVNPRQEAKKQEETIQPLNQVDEQITAAESPKVEQKKVASESVSTPSPKSKSKAKKQPLQEAIQTPIMQRKLKQQGIYPSIDARIFFSSKTVQ